MNVAGWFRKECKDAMAELNAKRTAWLLENPNVIRTLAGQTGLSQQQVKDRVFDRVGNTVSLRLEMKLAEMECPGFDEFKRSAGTRAAL
jgi:hypothetical protein